MRQLAARIRLAERRPDLVTQPRSSSKPETYVVRSKGLAGPSTIGLKLRSTHELGVKNWPSRLIDPLTPDFPARE